MVSVVQTDRFVAIEKPSMNIRQYCPETREDKYEKIEVAIIREIIDGEYD